MDLDLSWNRFPTQDICYNDVTTKTLMFSGGLGSGKTRYLCHKALKLSVLNRGFSGGFLVPSYADFKKDVYPTFSEIFHNFNMRENVHYWFHKTDKTYKFVWNKEPLYIFTGETSIKGPNLAYALINEHSSIQYERIKEMMRRVRVKAAPYKQINLAGTPEDVHLWLEEFLEAQEKLNEDTPGSFAVHYADTRENTEIDDGYRKHLESMLDEQSLKIFAGGQIGVIRSGNVFYYAFNKEKHVTDQVKEQPNLTVYANIDFNVGLMSCTLVHIINTTKQKQVHVFDEIILKNNGVDYSDTYALGQALLDRYPKDRVLITCDASGAARRTTGTSDVIILQSMGFNVRYKASNIRMRKRQILVNGLMSKDGLLVHPKCKTTIRDFLKVVQERDFTKSKNNPELTHSSDTLDYLIDFEYNLEERERFTSRKFV